MCGVFGIRSPDRDVARIAYFGLFALQHRGQESAGIAVSDRGRITALREMGLVSQVFSEEKLRGLRGELAIGHTRYSTTGSTHWANAQPRRAQRARSYGRARAQRQPDERSRAPRGACRARRPRSLDVRQRDDRGADRARRRAARGGSRTHDREARRRLLVRRARGEPADRVSGPARHAAALPRPDRRRLGRGLRDVRARPRRRRLRARGRPRRSGADRRRRREVAAGASRRRRRALCIFEFFYLARPDSRLAGVEVHSARVRMGERLAEESPVEADLVLPIPDSGTPAAIGFSRATGIPFSEGLIKNRYVGRTFIQPEQGLREQGIRLKFNPLAEVAGKRVVVVDDSIVRGNTTRQIVRMLFDAGASEVHVRISSPPVIGPCFYGIDLADEDELVAARRSVEAVRSYIGASSLALPLARRAHGGDAAPGVGALPRLPHSGLSDPSAGRGGKAPLRAGLVAGGAQVADPLSRIRDRLAPKGGRCAAAAAPITEALASTARARGSPSRRRGRGCTRSSSTGRS